VAALFAEEQFSGLPSTATTRIVSDLFLPPPKATEYFADIRKARNYPKSGFKTQENMDKIIVHGGSPLSGSVRISGSKNSALPILAATLLTKDECVISRVPDLSDIHFMLTILSELGCEVERASGTVSVKAIKIATEAPYEIVRKMRASVCILGPLLGREKEATVSLPGGCVIGDRPIDLHLKGFEPWAPPCEWSTRCQGIGPGSQGRDHQPARKIWLHGARHRHVLMAAVLADGTTVIDGAAEEPEVEDLANFLIKMGAKSKGAGTRRIIVEGVKRAPWRRARCDSGSESKPAPF